MADNKGNVSAVNVLDSNKYTDFIAKYAEEKGVHQHAFLFSAFLAWLTKSTAQSNITLLVNTEKDERFTYAFDMTTFDTFWSLCTAVNKELTSTVKSIGLLIVQDLSTTPNDLLKSVLIRDNTITFHSADAKMNPDVLAKMIDSITLHIELHGDTARLVDLPMYSDLDDAVYEKLNNSRKPEFLNLTVLDIWYRNLPKFADNQMLEEEGLTLSYSDVENLSNKVANMLLDKGVRAGDFVPVFMNRGIDIVISLLGIMKIGAIYIPLDPTYPEDRSRHILGEADPKVIFTAYQYKDNLKFLETNNAPLLFYQEANSYSAEKIKGPVVTPSSVAYMLYTSGSTGMPKGAQILHEGIANLALSTAGGFELNEDSKVAQFVSYNFDPSIADTFSTISAGASLYFLTEEDRLSAESFATSIKQKDITHVISLPAAFFNQVVQCIESIDLGNLGYIGIGGEALPVATVCEFQKYMGTSVTLFNLYGPTECTVTSSWHKINYMVDPRMKSMPIGSPLPNYMFQIFDDNMNMCGTSIPGELYINSVGLSLGYFKNDVKTKDAFIILDIDGKNVRYYKTGDIVRLLGTGEIEYVTRKDWQVKIRGHRIEIGEIENCMLEIEDIKEAHVLPKVWDDGEKYLVAFFTTKTTNEVSQEKIVGSLKKKLPSYMIPTYMKQLETIPLSPTGKIDRKALAIIDVENTATDVPTSILSATETIIAECWQKVLKNGNIRPTTHFFNDLRGHSLNIMPCLVNLKPKFPFLTIKDFFMHPVLKDLATHIDNHVPANRKSASTKDVRTVELKEYPYKIGNPVVDTRNTYEHILLTGATGFLGSHLLKEILETTEAVVYCIVRNGDMEKLQNTMVFYFGTVVLKHFDRVVVFDGDLSKPNLGLESNHVQFIHETVDCIIHCGANVNHFGKQEDFSDVNVTSTNTLLNMAKNGRNTRFHYISTLGILESLAAEGKDLSSYEMILNFDDIEGDLYTQSKLNSEKLVEIYAGFGVEASIYRIGNLIGNSQNGKFQTNIDQNAFYRHLKSVMLLGAAPNVKWEVDLTPVNFASSAILSLAINPNTAGRVFHICNPNTIAYVDLVGILNEVGYKIGLMPLGDFESWLLDGVDDKNAEGLELAMSHFDGEGARDTATHFSCDTTLEYLPESTTCTPPNGDFIHKLIEYARGIGFFPSK